MAFEQSQDHLCIEKLSADQCDELVVVAELFGDLEAMRRALGRIAIHEHPRRHVVLQGAIGSSRRGYPTCEVLEQVELLKERWQGRLHYLPSKYDIAFATSYPVHLQGGGDLQSELERDLQSRHGASWETIAARLSNFVAAGHLGVLAFGTMLICNSIPDISIADRRCLASLNARISKHDFYENGMAFSFLWNHTSDYDSVMQFAKCLGVDSVVHCGGPIVTHASEDERRIYIGYRDGNVGMVRIRAMNESRGIHCDVETV